LKRRGTSEVHYLQFRGGGAPSACRVKRKVDREGKRRPINEEISKKQKGGTSPGETLPLGSGDLSLGKGGGEEGENPIGGEKRPDQSSLRYSYSVRAESPGGVWPGKHG